MLKSTAGVWPVGQQTRDQRCALQWGLGLQSAVHHVAPRQHETNRFHGEGRVNGSERSAPGTADTEDRFGGKCGCVLVSTCVFVCR